MRIYYGSAEDENMRMMFATVTGQMADGTLVYTEHTKLQVCSFIDHLLSLLRTYTQETFHNILPVGTE